MISGNAWNGVVDASFTTDCFLSSSPLQLLESGQFNKDVEVILGGNHDEGLQSTVNLVTNPDLLTIIASDWDHYGPLSLLDKSGLGDVTEEDVWAANTILDFYVGSTDNFNSDHLVNITNMRTDAAFWYGIHRTASLLVQHGVTVYQYLLTYR